MEIPAADRRTMQTVPEIIVSGDAPPTKNLETRSKVSSTKRKLEKTCSSTPRNQRSFLYRGSSHIISRIEWLCGLWGYFVASNPWKAILVSLLLSGISGCGLYYLTFEFRPYKLWVKEPSEFKEVHEWKMEKFPNTIRKHIAIWEMDNILSANAIKQMWTLHQEVEKSSSSKNNIKYVDVCLKVPSLISHSNEEILYDYESYDYGQNVEVPTWITADTTTTELSSETNKKIVKRSALAASEAEDYEYGEYADSSTNNEATQDISWLATLMNKPPSNSSHYISPEKASIQERNEHCQFVEELDLICYEESLLEVWGYNDAVITSLTDEKVLHDINEFRSSRVTGFPRNIISYLGGITRDETGKILSAKGALYTWYTKVNMEAIRNCGDSSCKVEIDLGSGEEVDVDGMEWEVHLTNVVNKFNSQGMPINLQASYLFGAVHRSALFEDFYWVCLGWILLIAYVMITLGKPFSDDSKIMPIFVGIGCVALSVLASYGLCTASGIPYGPLNSVLPILLIALGVDDMYVIINAWDSVKMDTNDIKIKTRKTLNKAGLAVTVTSLTDVIAFIIGATTKVPALRYFCVYAAVGISIVYILQVTMFVAAVVLHEKSRKPKKESCLPSINCMQPHQVNIRNNSLGKWMGKWSKFLLRPPVTAFVLLVTGFSLGIALSQTLELKQKFESVWLLPKSSDIYQWFKTMDEIFPKDGREGFIFFENVRLPEEIPELQKLTEDLRNNKYVSRVDAWFENLLEFIDREHLFKNKPLTKELFDDALTYFLFNEDGAKYRNDIVFDNKTELKCADPAPSYTTFKINFQYIRLNHDIVGETQNAMNSVRELVSSANISGYRAPWALSYGQWETDDVISHELLRNVLVVLVIVFVMTMILLASIRAALLVLICVLATLIDVAALMSFWGVTINTVSCIALVIAIGICVDYAAHITHGFLVAQGSRKFRAESALNHMGPAVLHGGISTLIAFVLLGPADTFVFISYFKILTGVAVFGLYHAIVLLPILLALLGPPPYSTGEDGVKSSGDSDSCTTESSTFPCTPSSITPTATPQSTTPNSPFADRSKFSSHDNASFVHDSSDYSNSKVKQVKLISPVVNKSVETQNALIGNQALQNMTLQDSLHKVNMHVKGKQRDKDDLEEIRNFSLIENPAIKKENVLKLYIKNS